ncbi:ribosomal protein S21e [Ordospora colligata]|uniref:Ribosomal protein S21e n=1 Tax=Ordospora colligata OC4 TaxID=1354746 RepID=A0A0B2UCQ3_9MICR|nr:ribosomal protein S21e [Ordospora colligata OC4]KHN68791.1 ribosomal protein S21e [Ordospora colligata OC4]TBU13825.1 ribosomal protein S21e [Ordospora colligata]TBU14014.1 ribosomal protein S21e [Ordospora colligata]TBU17683.1 ribosomal protein S21e [Ordospora colligata]
MAFERRICSIGKTAISSSDKASVQLTLAMLDQYGQITGNVRIYDISGAIRKSGLGDGLILEKIRADEAV